MKAKEIEALESYFKTQNEHWNGYAFSMLCEAMQLGTFENLEMPLAIFDKAVKLFSEHHATPLKAVQLYDSELDKHNLSTAQKLFISERVYKYLRASDFGDMDFSKLNDLLKVQYEKLKPESQRVPANTCLTRNIRDTLKQLIKAELEQLPMTLLVLAPAQRLNILCKLMPYVLPKVESINHANGEPESNQPFVWFE
jgi:hypothetical protein